MNRTIYTLLIISFLIFASCYTKVFHSDSLPRSTPASEGVSAGNILDFIEAMEKSRNELHSLMVLRHGKIIAEGWWSPYQSDLKHSLYSTSKSFTSTAVGFAVAEKRLSLSDKVVSFFPNDLPDTLNSYLASLTVKDLLTMSAGQEPDPTFNVVARDSNWVKGFLSTPVKYKPGSRFLYNTLATHMLSAIVQKVTGEKVVDYLKPRLFDPLKIKNVDWETDPQGRNTGGWGLRLKTEDLAKFGQLLLQKGKWNDIQILPSDWVEEATSFKIDQAPDEPQSKKDSSDWKQGYCYQFWRCRNNAFRADGAFGQYVIVLPEKDAVIVMTGESPDMQNELNLVWKYLLPAFSNQPIPADKDAENKLGDKLSSLTLPLFTQPAKIAIEKNMGGRTYKLEANAIALDSFSIDFGDGKLKVSDYFKNNPAEFSFGYKDWKYGKTSITGPGLLSVVRPAYYLAPFKVAGNYTWTDSTTLKTKLRYIESPHALTETYRFVKDSVYLEIENSFDFGAHKLVIKGVRK